MRQTWRSSVPVTLVVVNYALLCRSVSRAKFRWHRVSAGVNEALSRRATVIKFEAAEFAGDHLLAAAPSMRWRCRGLSSGNDRVAFQLGRMGSNNH